MQCTNSKCPLIGGLSYVHMECFERLQADLVAIVAKTVPGQDWSRQRRRNFLWNWRGLKLVHKYFRCRCGKGLMMLDRDAWEISKALRKEENQKRTAHHQNLRK
ncbi:headcase protein-like protein [Aphelenchoides avenae]|nr:headcase protein-like protein [Aphelenchus avenae]